mmetsp:Transcript_22965/g.35384  ORF Transcript_22965/g.35384 Transcript_22965/m.35384 type:complete len:81 (+) Transcript_22965:1039-1281(+)
MHPYTTEHEKHKYQNNLPNLKISDNVMLCLSTIRCRCLAASKESSGLLICLPWKPSLASSSIVADAGERSLKIDATLLLA